MSTGSIGVVAIGRNEGVRLQACLNSVRNADYVVYVDSGSTDDSLEIAKASKAIILSLDMSIPFTAARARNEGFLSLLEECPQLEFVQFIDGDCEMQPDWLAFAKGYMQENPDVVVTCGRRRERYPEQSVYNLLCDIEWDTPCGDALACGGDALMRVRSLKEVNGFNVSLIAGEEPELCVRLRKAGGKIVRLDKEMTLHDAAIKKMSQWWARSVRGGFAFACGAKLHGAPPERHWVRETQRALFWGAVLPFVILTLSVVDWRALALFLVYPLKIISLAVKERNNNPVPLQYAVWMMFGKFAEAWGALKFYAHLLLRRQSTLIEYK